MIERTVLASILDSQVRELPPFLTTALKYAPEFWTSPECKLIALAVRKAREREGLSDTATVSKYLEPEYFQHLMAIANEPGSALGLELAERHAKDFCHAAQNRRIAATIANAFEAVKQRPDQADKAFQNLIALAPELGDLQELKARKFDSRIKPSQPGPIYYIDDVPICTPGNISNVHAPPKSGKTSLLSGMQAAVLAEKPEEADCLGFRSRNPDQKILLHFDTEQSPYDHWVLCDRTLRRAGVKDQPPWFWSYCLTGFSVERCREIIVQIMGLAAQDAGIHSVLIDGPGDLVLDVNDPKEANLFVSELHALSIKHACCIINVIHQNPNSEKTRGHLGSQLERKAETNLKVERDGDHFVVWSDKNRRAPIPKSTGPRFIWSDELNLHVSIKSTAPTAQSASQTSIDLKAKFLAHVPLEGSILQNVLLARVNELADIGQNRCRTLLAELLEERTLHLWKIKRPKTNAEKRISRLPQPADPQLAEPVPAPPPSESQPQKENVLL